MVPLHEITIFLITSALALNSVSYCVPIDKSSNEASQFQEVYDQRQNGTENYRVDVKDVILVWTPPGGLLQAASLLDPALFDADYAELEDFFKPDNKPQDLIVVKPESTTTSTTQKPTPSEEVPSQAPKQSHVRRRLRLPGFIRPFLRHQIN